MHIGSFSIYLNVHDRNINEGKMKSGKPGTVYGQHVMDLRVRGFIRAVVEALEGVLREAVEVVGFRLLNLHCICIRRIGSDS